MDEQEDLQTIHEVYEAFGRGDVEGVRYEDSAAVVAALTAGTR